MTESAINLTQTDPRSMAGFQLDASGLDTPGIDSGVDYVDHVATRFPQLAKIQANTGMYADRCEPRRAHA